MQIENKAVVITSAVLLIRQISSSRHSLFDLGTLLALPDLGFSGTLSHPYSIYGETLASHLWYQGLDFQPDLVWGKLWISLVKCPN